MQMPYGQRLIAGQNYIAAQRQQTAATFVIMCVYGVFTFLIYNHFKTRFADSEEQAAKLESQVEVAFETLRVARRAHELAPGDEGKSVAYWDAKSRYDYLLSRYERLRRQSYEGNEFAESMIDNGGVVGIQVGLWFLFAAKYLFLPMLTGSQPTRTSMMNSRTFLFLLVSLISNLSMWATYFAIYQLRPSTTRKGRGRCAARVVYCPRRKRTTTTCASPSRAGRLSMRCVPPRMSLTGMASISYCSSPCIMKRRMGSPICEARMNICEVPFCPSRRGSCPIGSPNAYRRHSSPRSRSAACGSARQRSASARRSASRCAHTCSRMRRW